jgi:hypothetical protein
MNNPLRYIDPSGHFCEQAGKNVICSEDDDSDGWWLPPDDNPHPLTNPSDLLIEITDDHGIRSGNNYSESIDWNIDWIHWNYSRIPYEINRREVKCDGCTYAGLGILVDILGIVADIDLVLTGDPILSTLAAETEAAHFAWGIFNKEVDIYDAQLYQDQRLADVYSQQPITGIVYSLWEIWLNINDIVQRFDYKIR